MIRPAGRKRGPFLDCTAAPHPTFVQEAKTKRGKFEAGQEWSAVIHCLVHHPRPPPPAPAPPAASLLMRAHRLIRPPKVSTRHTQTGLAVSIHAASPAAQRPPSSPRGGLQDSSSPRGLGEAWRTPPPRSCRARAFPSGCMMAAGAAGRRRCLGGLHPHVTAA
jgi:hypothetical protein